MRLLRQHPGEGGVALLEIQLVDDLVAELDLELLEELLDPLGGRRVDRLDHDRVGLARNRCGCRCRGRSFGGHDLADGVRPRARVVTACGRRPRDRSRRPPPTDGRGDHRTPALAAGTGGLAYHRLGQVRRDLQIGHQRVEFTQSLRLHRGGRAGVVLAGCQLALAVSGVEQSTRLRTIDVARACARAEACPDMVMSLGNGPRDAATPSRPRRPARVKTCVRPHVRSLPLHPTDGGRTYSGLRADTAAGRGLRAAATVPAVRGVLGADRRQRGLRCEPVPAACGQVPRPP